MSRTVVTCANGSKRYFVNGREVSESEYGGGCVAQGYQGNPNAKIGGRKSRKNGRTVGGIFKKPIASESFAVNPNQIAAFTEATRKAGVATEFDAKGRALIKSVSHGRKLCKAYGHYHINFG